MRLEAAVEIAAPPDVVFAQVADIERWPQTVRAIEDIELITAGPVRVGTRFRETRTMFGRKAAEEMTVAEFDPPRRFVLTAENHGTRYVATHAVEPVADGSRLVLAFEGVPVTLAARLFSVIGSLFTGALRRQLNADLADLKAAIERRAPVPMK